MVRKTRRMGQQKVLVVFDRALIEQLDKLLTEFDPKERMNRSELIQDILYYSFEEGIIDEIFPEERSDKFKRMKDKILSMAKLGKMKERNNKLLKILSQLSKKNKSVELTVLKQSAEKLGMSKEEIEKLNA